MKLVEMKCKNCGTMLKVEEGATSITCEYCHTTYSIDDEAQHIKYDNMYESGYEFEKGRIKAQDEKVEEAYNAAKPANRLITAIVAIIIIAASIGVGLITYKLYQESLKPNTAVLNMNRQSFNGVLEMYSGTQSRFLVNALLDNIITNNKKDTFHTVTVVYNDVSTSDPNEITSIKQSLEDRNTDGTPIKYEVMFDYNGDGVIYKTVIEKIEN